MTLRSLWPRPTERPGQTPWQRLPCGSCATLHTHTTHHDITTTQPGSQEHKGSEPKQHGKRRIGANRSDCCRGGAAGCAGTPAGSAPQTWPCPRKPSNTGQPQHHAALLPMSKRAMLTAAGRERSGPRSVRKDTSIHRSDEQGGSCMPKSEKSASD